MNNQHIDEKIIEFLLKEKVTIHRAQFPVIFFGTIAIYVTLPQTPSSQIEYLPSIMIGLIISLAAASLAKFNNK